MTKILFKRLLVTAQQVDSQAYYATYNGHDVGQLEIVYRRLKEQGCQQFIFYAGDSSLDNKFWVKEVSPAINGYENILHPPTMRQDVDYWMNKLLFDHNKKTGQKVCSIMTSVEASMLHARKNVLLPQDSFIKDHLSSEDYLIVSVGGNDIALAPSAQTQNALQTLKNDPSNTQALKHLQSIVGEDTKKYIEKLIAKKIPKKILVSMIYYPDESDTPSWASGILNAFGYSDNPSLLQNLTKLLFEKATKQIAIAGAIIVPAALFLVLDGKVAADYVSRVEPSAQGGKKMAEFSLREIFNY